MREASPPGRRRSVPRRPTTTDEFAPGWSGLVAEIGRCTRCPLYRTRHHVVVYRGGPHPRVLFVGEAPGAEEDRQGIPFVGRSGERLDRAIASLGLRPGTFGVLNLIKCRPPGNRFDQEAAATCRPFLDRQIDLLDPPWIVPLGAHALASLLPGSPRITVSAGHRVAANGRLYLPLLHPAAALHRPTLRDRWDSDLATLRSELARPVAPE